MMKKKKLVGGERGEWKVPTEDIRMMKRKVMNPNIKLGGKRRGRSEVSNGGITRLSTDGDEKPGSMHSPLRRWESRT